MVVQEMLEYLRDVLDNIAESIRSGTATISQGNSSVVVSHGLSTPNYGVAVAPLADPGNRVWVSNKTSVSFQINLQAAAPAGGVPFDWIVKAR